MPPDVLPMLATSGIPPRLDGWVAEPKLMRARILVDLDGISVPTRSGRDITANVHGLELLSHGALRAVLDGEFVAGGGRLADFFKVGPALARRRPVAGRTVAFAAFDLPWHEGELLTSRAHSGRRAILDGLDLAELGVATIPMFNFDEAPALFQACASHGVEGLVLKGLASPYQPGKRTASWRKVKMCPVGGAPGTATQPESRTHSDTRHIR